MRRQADTPRYETRRRALSVLRKRRSLSPTVIALPVAVGVLSRIPVERVGPVVDEDNRYSYSHFEASLAVHPI
jgi:hypothetical protein